MDQPIINESSFSTANPSSYSLTEIWPFNEGGLGLKIGGGFVGDSGESSVTEQSGNGGRKTTNNSEEDETSLLVSNTSHDLSNLNGKRMKISGSKDELSGLKVDGEGSSGSASKAAAAEQSSKQSEPPKDYIHVRARRGQATDIHSLAERARREKISERMKILQDLVPGCNKGIGKVLIVDQIINYTQSLQHQVEFLSMKLEAVNTRMSSPIEGFPTKESNLNGKRMKISGLKDELSGLGVNGEGSSGSGSKVAAAEQSSKQTESPKDYIHVRARRNQATDSPNLAERARREMLSARMKILQDLVPGCNKGIGKVLMLDEVINYIQSLQHQVEFLSMKLEAGNTRMSSPIEGFPTKEVEKYLLIDDEDLVDVQVEEEVLTRDENVATNEAAKEDVKAADKNIDVASTAEQDENEDEVDRVNRNYKEFWESQYKEGSKKPRRTF